MSIEVQLKDGEGQGHVASVLQKNGWKGLAVFTEPLRQKATKLISFSSPSQGANMAVDATFTGAPIPIYDGNDNTYWTGTAIIGTVWSDSTNRAYSGAASLRYNRGAVGDTFQFDKGSAQDLTGYSAVTFAINVNRGWSSNPVESVELYGWDTGGGTQVGTRVKIENYFTQNSFDVWQLVSIPLADLGVATATLDAFRLEVVGVVGATTPDFFIDDLQVELTGGGVEYRYVVEPTDGTNYFAREIRFTLADNVASTVANGTVPGLAYNTLLGLPALSIGIILRVYEDEKVVFSSTFKQLSDFFLAGFDLGPVVSDGTNTSVTLSTVFADDIVLRRLGRMEIEINDDLTGLLECRAVLRGSEETL